MSKFQIWMENWWLQWVLYICHRICPPFTPGIPLTEYLPKISRYVCQKIIVCPTFVGMIPANFGQKNNCCFGQKYSLKPIDEVVCRVEKYQQQLAHQCSPNIIGIWEQGTHGLNLSLNGWSTYGPLGQAFMTYGWGIYITHGWGTYDLMGGAFVT